MELADQIFVIGYEKNEKGHYLEGGTVIKQYDLKQMGLAWRPYSAHHQQIKEEIKAIIETN